MDKLLIEYLRHFAEMLVEEACDCEDQAILTAYLLKRMGFDVTLLMMPSCVAVGLRVRKVC